MKRIAKLAFVSCIVALTSAAAGHCGGLFENGSPELEQTLRSFDGRFDVQPYYNWGGAFPGDGPQSVEERTPSAIVHIQEAILANRTLADRLEQHGVQIRNVINAEQAADGSITFYTD
jgi:hypothetical protein